MSSGANQRSGKTSEGSEPRRPRRRLDGGRGHLRADGRGGRAVRPAVWLAFGAAGIIALLSGHSFVQLGIRYLSRGGLVECLGQAYGMGRFSGACSILFYIAQLIGMAMISLAFGKYAAMLVGIESNRMFWERVLGSGLIVGLSALALVGADADLAVFDPATVTDRATIPKGSLPAEGIPFVVVNGTVVVKDSKVLKGVYPGQPIRLPVQR